MSREPDTHESSGKVGRDARELGSLLPQFEAAEGWARGLLPVVAFPCLSLEALAGLQPLASLLPTTVQTFPETFCVQAACKDSPVSSKTYIPWPCHWSSNQPKMTQSRGMTPVSNTIFLLLIGRIHTNKDAKFRVPSVRKSLASAHPGGVRVCLLPKPPAADGQSSREAGGFAPVGPCCPQTWWRLLLRRPPLQRLDRPAAGGWPVLQYGWRPAHGSAAMPSLPG